MHEVLNNLVEYKVVLDKADKVIHGRLNALNASISSLADEEEVK